MVILATPSGDRGRDVRGRAERGRGDRRAWARRAATGDEGVGVASNKGEAQLGATVAGWRAPARPSEAERGRERGRPSAGASLAAAACGLFKFFP